MRKWLFLHWRKEKREEVKNARALTNKMKKLIICSICLIICLVIFSCILGIWGGLPAIQDNLKSKSFLWRSTTAKNITAKFLKIITESDICNWECMLFGAWSDKYNMSLLSTNCIEIKNFHMFVVFVRLKNFPKRLFYVRFEKFRRHKEINHVTLFFFFCTCLVMYL